MTEATGWGSIERACLAAWDGYAATFRALLAHHKGVSSAADQPTAPWGPAWLAFAASMGLDNDAAGAPPAGLAAVGWSREYQESAQRIASLTVRFQQRYAELMEYGAGVIRDATATVYTHSSASAAASPASWYDDWIEAAEAAYAPVAHGEAFGAALGDLCNIMSEFKIERGKLLERMARHLDLPSRAEVDTLHRQVRELCERLNPAPPKRTASPKRTAPRKRAKPSKRPAPGAAKRPNR